MTTDYDGFDADAPSAPLSDEDLFNAEVQKQARELLIIGTLLVGALERLPSREIVLSIQEADAIGRVLMADGITLNVKVDHEAGTVTATFVPNGEKIDEILDSIDPDSVIADEVL